MFNDVPINIKLFKVSNSGKTIPIGAYMLTLH